MTRAGAKTVRMTASARFRVSAVPLAWADAAHHPAIGARGREAYGQEAQPPQARAMPRKSSALRLAPPTSAPSTLATPISSAAFDGFTEPP
jgi:hypothetical protein